MGFLEAGRAAARLMADAAIDAIDGMTKRDVLDDDDDERGAQRRPRVLDVDVLDYSPTRMRRGDVVGGYGRRGWGGQDSDDGRGGRTGGRRVTTPRGWHERSGGVGVGVVEDREKRRHGRLYARDHGTIHVNRRHLDEGPRPPGGNFATSRNRPTAPGGVMGSEGDGALPSAGETSATTPDDVVIGPPMRSRRTVRDGSDVGAPRRIYGLYHRETDISMSPDQVDFDPEVGAKEVRVRSRERHSQWKDRLRRKFDVALGLESPPSSSSSSKMTGTYYDSWRAQIKGMGDERKELMRRRMNELNDSSLRNGELRRAAPSSSSPYRNNRRARMRAKKKTPPLYNRVSPSQRSINPPKSHLDEVPFWKERGSIASFIFENRPSSASSRVDNRQTMGRKSLEHTVTSLFLYVSRSALTAFGILCRWAGVRGTIPQPIVVTSVIATILSSRGGQKVLSLVLILLAMRLVGEFLHGLYSGNEFWDDEYDFQSRDWKNKPPAK
ncbi:hypothetical protein ACHAXA_011440 [Cyclostephanos tholiformis]|uniref:Uncharacterized protein n=1 Tax=Cyclostephanos tholiformis TaxID=382380 RepID=A0ABD3RVW3_9STRA